MNIVSLPIVIDEKQVDSRFRLVILAAQRVRELSEGSKPLVPTRYLKPTTIALEEILSGRIRCLTGEEARKALEEARKARAAAAASLQEEAHPELEELEKDLKVYLHEGRIETVSEEKPEE